jgi:hypothetical protein
LGPERESGWEKATVYVKRLDARNIAPGNAPLIKIDVEGAEYKVFQGMPNFLKSRPTIILETFAPFACDFINSLLPNYRFYLIDEGGRLIERDRLVPADISDLNKNQLLQPKERAPILL